MIPDGSDERCSADGNGDDRRAQRNCSGVIDGGWDNNGLSGYNGRQKLGTVRK